VRYDPALVQPMRDELTRAGFVELKTPEAVDAALGVKDETVLLVVNSVCGCAAGKARPGVLRAMRHSVRPTHLATVFAGMEMEATERARRYFEGYPPSSPQIGLLKNGRLLHLLERKDIEGREADAIAEDLIDAFNSFCAQPG